MDITELVMYDNSNIETLNTSGQQLAYEGVHDSIYTTKF